MEPTNKKKEIKPVNRVLAAVRARKRQLEHKKASGAAGKILERIEAEIAECDEWITQAMADAGDDDRLPDRPGD